MSLITLQILRSTPSKLSMSSNAMSHQLRRMSGEIRQSGGSFSKKEQAQEDMWAHKRDLEHLRQLQDKLKKAQQEVQDHTEKILKKNSVDSGKK